MGLRAKFLRLSALLCIAESGIPAIRLSGPRSFFRDLALRRPSTKCSTPSTREYWPTRCRENWATVKFELVASPARGQTALRGPVRDAPKRLPVLRMSEAAATQAKSNVCGTPHFD
jgi:hypothetical protein